MTSQIKLLYLSSNEWGNLGRRKIRLAYEFARQNSVAAVLYVNPPVVSSVLDVMRGRFMPSHLGDSRRAHFLAILGRSRQVTARLWIYTGSTKTLPLTRSERLQRSRLLSSLNQRLYIACLRRQIRQLPGGKLVVWLSHPLQFSVLDFFPERKLACYDWTDDWLQFSILPVADRTELEQATHSVLRQVDMVLAVSQSLYQRAREINPNTYRTPNATDFELIGRCARVDMPVAPELQAIPGPRLGYIGQIGDNLDFSLIRDVAKTRPEWSMVFIGPIWNSKEAEVDSLTKLGNVYFLGGRLHSQLPGFLRGFDVCLLPHLRNNLTLSMDPTKLYDYLASSKPIVSTSVGGTERFSDMLYLCDTSAEFIAGIEDALAENGTKGAHRVDCARQNSWPKRASDIWKTLTSRIASQ